MSGIGGSALVDGTELAPVPCIDDFDVGQELGRGGFAVVYRARVRLSGLEVALKVVDKHRACELATSTIGNAGSLPTACDGVELACARVANEVRLHWGLKHPTVVELFDFFEDERFVYMVLELCGGGDLYRTLKARGPLGEGEAAGYMGQLLAGLAYLHGRRIVHRDLKLSNLLLSRDGRRLRIADFGLAVKLEDGDHETHTICGTPNYMAPEVQDSGYGLSADLWSAGCLFYAMVTGGAPFQGRLVGETLSNARAGRYTEPEGLSEEAKDFLACMLELDPMRRLSVEQAAAHPFLCLDKDANRTKSCAHRNRGPSKLMSTGVVMRRGGQDGESQTVRAPPPALGAEQGGKQPASSFLFSKGKAKTAGDGVVADRSAYRSPSSSLQSSPHGSSGGGRGAESGASKAVGHHSSSTLTASTAVLGSDRCSLNSSLMEVNGEDGYAEDAASFTTMRAEAVPTPATIGEGAAAAAARVRRAAARAPLRGSLLADLPDSADSTNRVLATPAGWKGGRDLARARTGGSPCTVGGSLRDYRRSGVDSAFPPVRAKERREEGENDQNPRAGSGGHHVGTFGDDGPGRTSVRKVEKKEKEEAEFGSGSCIRGNGRKGDVADGAGVGCKSRRERLRLRAGSSVGAAGVAIKSGTANANPLVESGGRFLHDVGSDKDIEKRGDAETPSRRGRALHIRGTTDKFSTRKPTVNRHDLPVRNGNAVGVEQEAYDRLHEGSREGVGLTSGSSRLDGQPQRRAWKQQQRQAHGLTTPAHLGVDGAVIGGVDQRMQRRFRRHYQQYSYRDTSSDSSSGTSDVRGNSTRPNRRRQRPVGGRSDGKDMAARPLLPPPRPSLPSQPPPLPGDDKETFSSESSGICELNALRDAAAAERRLHEPLGAFTDSTSRGGDTATQRLLPLSTARVQPVSHCLGGMAAVEVLPDGRATITVGKRWLVTSPDGRRVWSGSTSDTGRHSGSSEAADAAGRASAVEERIESLPESLHPLYRSLVGIVDALRSKTAKVVLRRREQQQQPSGSAGQREDRRIETRNSGDDGKGPRGRIPAFPRELASCALMDNLPEPDFAAAFNDGASLSLWTRKRELRVEIPSGRVRSWPLVSGSEWPVIESGCCCDCNDNLTPSGDRERKKEMKELEECAAYLRAGLRGYCMCLREEAAAYREGGQFPIEIVMGDLEASVRDGDGGRGDLGGVIDEGGSNGCDAANAEGRYWWRGDEDDGSSSSASARGSERIDDKTVSARPDGNGTYRRVGRITRGYTDAVHSNSNIEQDRVHLTGDSVLDADNSERRQRKGHERKRPQQRSHRGDHLFQDRAGLACRAQQERSAVEGVERPARCSTASSFASMQSVVDRSSSPAALAAATAYGNHEDAKDRRTGDDFEHREQHRRRPARDTARPPESVSASIAASSSSGFSWPSWSLDVCTVSAATAAVSAAGSLNAGGVEGSVTTGGRGRLANGAAGAAVGAAVIPGVGRAVRDSRGDLEVTFEDGVVVVVDAQAKWMRVEEPQSVGQPVASVSYDLRKSSTGKKGTRDDGRDGYVSGGGVGTGTRAGRERMPRDVKQKMKALPRFISVLKQTSEVVGVGNVKSDEYRR